MKMKIVFVDVLLFSGIMRNDKLSGTLPLI